jgi:hypothetical protein
MERAAETGAAVGQAAQMRGAAALEAVGSHGGRTRRLGRGDDLGWSGCRRYSWGGWVTAGSHAGLHARLTRECGFVPPLARAGGGGHARR